MAHDLTLVLGGIRSGKSAFAEQIIKDLHGPTLYLATGLATDPEMEARIQRHRASRPSDWVTLEEPLNLAPVLDAALADSDPPKAVLVDCLDVWVSNMLLDKEDQDRPQIESETLSSLDALLETCSRYAADVVMVSSEVGLSLVSTYALGRGFQDILGLVNQRVAAVADRVYLVVAGIPLEIKSTA